MRTALFAACTATYATVEAASLVSFPTYDLHEIDVMEFAETFDEDAFNRDLSRLAQHDNTPIDVNSFMQSLSETDAKAMGELLSVTHLLAEMQANG